MNHSERHPQFVEGCFGCKARSVYMSASAMPSRKPAVMQTNDNDKQLAKDMDAYKRLRRQGVQPRHVDGSANVEARAETKFEIESGNLLPKEKYGAGVERRVKEGLAMVQDLKDAG